MRDFQDICIRLSSLETQNLLISRYLITSSGYIEGWATYIESYGYQYASNYLDDNDGSDYVCLTWLNRSINLCIYSLLDIGIHYYGWSQDEAARLLKLFGITKYKCNI